MARKYPDAVIGSTVDLPFTARDVITRALINLEELGVLPTCRIVDEDNNPIISDEACIVSGTQGKYRWTTTSRSPGRYRVQFTLPNGVTPAPAIGPAEPIEIDLVASI